MLVELVSEKANSTTLGVYPRPRMPVESEGLLTRDPLVEM